MERQSGIFLFGTILLVSALSLPVSDSSTESVLTLQVACSEITGGHGLNSRTSIQPTRTILQNLPRGTRIVIGSLDVSGGRHVITLRSTPSGPASTESTAVVRLTANDIQRRTNFRLSDFVRSPAFTRNSGQTERRPVTHLTTTAYSTSGFGTIGLAVSHSRRSSNPDQELWNREPPHHSVFLAETAKVDAQQVASRSQSRVFLVPQFNDAGVFHKPTECSVIDENNRVRLYLDDRLMNYGSADEIAASSRRLISAAALQSLPIVEEWIGLVSDVDRDLKLSIVITDLDQRSKQVAEASPIYGCIREADFHSDACFGGDIVYMEKSILGLPEVEQASLLTHELTHAAICSLEPTESEIPTGDVPDYRCHSTSVRIPSWLNEAIAHLMELHCRENGRNQRTPQNFRRRIDDFLADSAHSPIVAAEHTMNMDERRRGSRAAATLFLAPWLTSPEALRRFLHFGGELNHRIEDLTQCPFTETFREWTLSIAAPSVYDEQLRLETITSKIEPERYSLLGTSFRCFKCSEDVALLLVESDAAAGLQISIIEPDSSPATLATAETQKSELQ